MTILPASTEPYTARIVRRHQPAPSRYDSYRVCLRWEFGFTCAFCLLHEADLIQAGARGSGLFSIEHRVARRHAPDQADTYANCFYACRFCNRPPTAEETAAWRAEYLLDPCTSTWSEHFQLVEDELVPRAGDERARATARVYDLGDPRKIAMRRRRREALEGAVRLLREGPGLVDALLARADSACPAAGGELLAVAAELQRQMDAALSQLRQLAAVPPDAPGACRCGDGVARDLPAALAAQCGAAPAG